MSRDSTLDIPVRWGDLDAFNHVNNTVFLRFIEEARIHFFAEIDERMMAAGDGPVVVNINCNFRREIRYPATVRMILTAHQASAKRLVMEHTLIDAEHPDRLYADAEATVLWVSGDTGGSIPLPENIVSALQNNDTPDT